MWEGMSRPYPQNDGFDTLFYLLSGSLGGVGECIAIPFRVVWTFVIPFRASSYRRDRACPVLPGPGVHIACNGVIPSAVCYVPYSYAICGGVGTGRALSVRDPAICGGVGTGRALSVRGVRRFVVGLVLPTTPSAN